MKLEAATDSTPREVVARALADLLAEGWTLRSMSENHVHLAGKRERDSTWLRATLLAVLGGFLATMALLAFGPAYASYEIGGRWRTIEELIALYNLVAWPTALVLTVVHLLARRGDEAGIAVAATPHPAGGSIVMAQAYGSALAEERVEAFVERLQRPGDGATVRLADRMDPR